MITLTESCPHLSLTYMEAVSLSDKICRPALGSTKPHISWPIPQESTCRVLKLTSQPHHVPNFKMYGASAFFYPLPSLKDSARLLPVLTSLDSVNIIFCRTRCSALRPTPNLEDKVRVFMPPVTGWPSYTPRQWANFSPPFTSRRATLLHQGTTNII
jgi:hypothetical protein